MWFGLKKEQIKGTVTNVFNAYEFLRVTTANSSFSDLIKDDINKEMHVYRFGVVSTAKVTKEKRVKKTIL